MGFKEAINELVSSDRYEQLAQCEPGFSPFRVLGVEHRELSHSNLLAWLLQHPDFREFQAGFLKSVAESARNRGLEKLEAELAALEPDDIMWVRTEFMCIDLVIKFSRADFVVAVENKIWAVEGDRQLETYQKALEDWRGQDLLAERSCIVFLTIDGDDPLTGDTESSVPIITLSWKRVGELLEKNADLGSSALCHFRTQIVDHIKEDLMQDTREKKLVYELLSEPKHRETIRKIVENLPTLEDVRDEWNRRVRAHIDNRWASAGWTCKIEPYRSQGEIKELKVYVTQWEEENLPFCFMLYNYEDIVAVRTFVRSTCFNDPRVKEELESFARENSSLINLNYPKLGGWCWKMVFRDDTDEPNRTTSVFEENYLEQVLEEFQQQFDRLAERVLPWLEHKSV